MTLTTLILIIFAAALLTLLGWTLRSLFKLQRSEVVALERANGLQTRATELQTEVERLNFELSQKRDDLVRADSEMKNLGAALDQQKQMLDQAEQKFMDSFKSLAATALEGNNRQFLELAKSVLSRANESAKGDLEKRQIAIDSLLKPLQETLTRYEKQAIEMERERQKSYTTVENELKRVIETGDKLSAQTTALKDALKRPHVRGRWGEVQLKNCIELAAMSEHCDVSFQDQNNSDEGRLIPDMVVRMPGGRVVVVDAKTPLDAFLSSLDATTDEQRTMHMSRHGAAVKDHVQKLSQKAYHDHLEGSADFTVMFLPNESFLYAALESHPDLIEYALEKRILVATPPTLIGLLKVIRYGWREERLAENAMAICEAGKEMHKRIADFLEAFESVGKHLTKAQEQFEAGRYRLHSRVLVQAKRMEALGAKSNKVIELDEVAVLGLPSVSLVETNNEVS